MEDTNPYPTGMPVQPEPPQYYYPKKPMAPGALATLILGIVSLSQMAMLGFIPAIIALSQFKKTEEAEMYEPGKYNPTSINMAHAGKKMATIGLVLGILGTIVTIVYYWWIFSRAMHHEPMYYDSSYDYLD